MRHAAGSGWRRAAGLAGLAAALWLGMGGPRAAGADAPAATTNLPVQVRADKMDYDRDSGWAEARGRVVVRYGAEELRADYVRVNLLTGDARAVGNVGLRRPEGDWSGRELEYNFKTRVGSAAELLGGAKPFVLKAEKVEHARDDSYILHGAELTTCTNAYHFWHYHVRAGKVRLVPDEQLEGWDAVFYFGRVPVMYLPYWWRDFNDTFGWRLRPGYSSRLGAYLLASYRYPLGTGVKSETHVDYYSRRGPGLGQDLDWRDPQGRWFGDLAAYYVHDREPVDDDEDAATADADSERYRFRLAHEFAPSERDVVRLQGHYLSDTDILEDFFEDEYRGQIQPDNYLSYAHRGQRYTVNALLRGRLNNFYESVDRLPEVAVDFARRPLGNSAVYYDGQTAAGFLRRVFPEGDEREDDDYSSLRFDTLHMLYAPRKFFGFLSVLPRGGYRGTYYSDTLETTTRDEPVVRVATNSVMDAFGRTRTVVTSTPGTNTIAETRELGADMRHLLELGAEVSFKAFKMWEGGVVSPLRHIVEPYLNYTFVPTPTLEPESIYDFDSVDTLGKAHWTKLGMRNKFQTKRDGRPFDLVDLDTYTIVNLDTDEDEDAIEHVYIDAELRPSERVGLDLDAVLGVADSGLDRFNAQLWVRRSAGWRADLEYRFVRDESSLAQGDVTLYPNRAWAFNLYARQEFENDPRLEEVGSSVQHNWDCLALRTGLGLLPGYTRTDGSEVDDEWRVVFELWLTAFPQFGIGQRDRRNG